jgi:hypothetical protein
MSNTNGENMTPKYRITLQFGNGYQGQFIWNDFDKDIDLAEWTEWGCNAAFHDTVIEKTCPQETELSITIKHIELIKE